MWLESGFVFNYIFRPAMTTPPQPSSSIRLTLSDLNPRWVDILAFASSLLLAFLLGWSSKDLLWGLWLTSFMGGISYTTWCLVIRKLLIKESAWKRIFPALAGLIGVAFFSLHFGMFHYVYASMLDLPWPLRSDPGRVYLGKLTWRGVSDFPFFETLWLAVQNYWMLAFINIGRDHENLFRVDAKFDSGQAYLKVLKLHFVMILMVFLNFLGLESFALFLIFFFILYAPPAVWKTLFPKLATNQKGQAPVASGSGPQT